MTQAEKEIRDCLRLYLKHLSKKYPKHKIEIDVKVNKFDNLN